jgi:hypothetical protein
MQHGLWQVATRPVLAAAVLKPILGESTASVRLST